MYVEIPFWRFALGLAVIAIPAVVLERTAERWAWRYVGLILLVLIVGNWRGFVSMTSFVRSEIRAVGS